MVILDDYQLKAIEDLKNGSILCGGVGSGKSRTSLGYYMFKVCNGSVKVNGKGSYKLMSEPRDLYIITTAKKRDTLEWDEECAAFCLNKDTSISHSGVKITVDSWNNISKYHKINGAFFIFDEQRVVGKGAWVKAFLDLARKNKWILLSATPGDTWSDYIPVFIANGFYKNRTEFNMKHVVYNSYTKFPKIERYIGEKELRRNRDSLLIHMKDRRKTERFAHYIICDYDKELYNKIFIKHWNPFDDEPIMECSKWFYLQRRAVNTDPSRIEQIKKILEVAPKSIIFYNYDYELEIIRNFCINENLQFSEWNGKKHQPLPMGSKWLYLVQYSAGNEGWNCITTDTIIFYSLNYSYRIMEQASGRIDRINTQYSDLHYYYLRSNSVIDMSIFRKIKNKKNFNEDAALFNKYKTETDSRKKHGL